MGKYRKSCIDILGNKWNYNCMGCSVSAGEIELPGGLIYNGNFVFLGQDPEVPIPGFLIVNVRRHVRSFSELSKEERIEIGNVIACAENALKTLGTIDNFTLVQEERSQHLHIWIFPNYTWMNEKFGKGITYLRDINDYCCSNMTQENVDEVLEVVPKVKKYFKEHYKEYI